MRRCSQLALGITLSVLSGCKPDDVVQPHTVAQTSGADLADVSDPTPSTIALEHLTSLAGPGPVAAEITTFDRVSQRLFVANATFRTMDVYDMKDPAAPGKVSTIDLSSFGSSVNSVAAYGGVVAVAVQGPLKTDAGTIVFYRATTLQQVSSVTVGALPDMVAFTPDGKTVLVANEGEPNDAYTIDPEGSVSVIDIHNINAPLARTASFVRYNGKEDDLRAAGIRIFGPNASAAQDFEPEYITTDASGRTAYVTLQENNAIAIVDVASASVQQVVPLGYKDHSVVPLDVSDRDGPGNGPAINIRTWPVPLFGMYQPDGIASYTVGGRTYLVTANEGDSRSWAGFTEDVRVSALPHPLNPNIFTNTACGGSCTSNARLGRLTVTSTMGLNPETNQYDALYAFGGRSFSIWDENGNQVWDSGAEFEQRTTSLSMVNFNADEEGNDPDNRSDNKGPEPEGVAVARLGAKTFAFVGLERVGGIMVYDVTSPTSPSFVTYANTRNGATGDRAPEGIVFVPAVDSPNKHPLLIVGNEASGSVAVFQIVLQ